MSNSITRTPQYLHQTIVVFALQNIVLSKHSQKEILKKGHNNIRPIFGNNFYEKIILRAPFFKTLYFLKTVSLPTINFNLVLIPIIILLYAIDIEKFLKNICINILRPLLMMVLPVTLTLFAIAIIGYRKAYIQFWQNKKKAPELKEALIQQDEWWDTEDGKLFYQQQMESTEMSEALQKAMIEFDIHSRNMSKLEHKGSQVLHGWHKNFYAAITLDHQNQMDVLPSRKPACAICRKIASGKQQIVEWSPSGLCYLVEPNTSGDGKHTTTIFPKT